MDLGKKTRDEGKKSSKHGKSQKRENKCLGSRIQAQKPRGRVKKQNSQDKTWQRKMIKESPIIIRLLTIGKKEKTIRLMARPIKMAKTLCSKALSKKRKNLKKQAFNEKKYKNH